MCRCYYKQNEALKSLEMITVKKVELAIYWKWLTKSNRDQESVQHFRNNGLQNSPWTTWDTNQAFFNIYSELNSWLLPLCFSTVDQLILINWEDFLFLVYFKSYKPSLINWCLWFQMLLPAGNSWLKSHPPQAHLQRSLQGDTDEFSDSRICGKITIHKQIARRQILFDIWYSQS